MSKRNVPTKEEKLFIAILSLGLLITLISFLLVKNLFLSKTNINKKAPFSGCLYPNLSGEIDISEKYAFFEGRKIDLPRLAYKEEPPNVLGMAQEERFVEVDLSEQKLKAWEGDKLFLETKVSTGLPWWPTPVGEYRIWTKLRATKMEGGSGKYYYYLPNVPYVMYFENSQIPASRGYGLHGTYWHNDFGTPRSHGCVNLPTDIAKQLYYWVNPVIPEGSSSVRVSQENPGTRVVIHE